MHTTTEPPTVPNPLTASFADVALIDAEKCAAIGDMSTSWWHEEVRAGRAPQPVIRQSRCTRWRVLDAVAYWRRRAEQGASDTKVAAAVIARATKASKAARAAAGVPSEGPQP